MDVHSAGQRSANMAAIKAKNTKPEMAVRRALHGLGFRYRLHRKDLPGKPDLVFAARRKVIFVHGCFWHMHDCRFGRVVPSTRTGFWQEKRKSNVTRDRVNLQTLSELGWATLVVWECETRDALSMRMRCISFLDRQV